MNSALMPLPFNRKDYEETYVSYAILWGFTAERVETDAFYEWWDFNHAGMRRSGYGTLFAAAVEWVRLSKYEDRMAFAMDAVHAGATQKLSEHLAANRRAEEDWDAEGDS